MQGALLWSTIGHIYLCIPAGILFNTVMSATEGFRILTTAYMTEALSPAFMLLPKLQHRQVLSSLINEQP